MPRQLEASSFDEILLALTSLPVVGGQAVNLWAALYRPRTRQLEEFHPFLSKDADLFGERPAIEAHAVPKGWVVQYYGIPRQMAVALITKELPDGEQLRVEVLRSVYGLGPRDLSTTLLVEVSPGRVYRLPSPIILLKAKIANTHDLVKKERPQDLKHVRMLVIICAHYLRDLHASVLTIRWAALATASTLALSTRAPRAAISSASNAMAPPTTVPPPPVTAISSVNSSSRVWAGNCTASGQPTGGMMRTRKWTN